MCAREAGRLPLCVVHWCVRVRAWSRPFACVRAWLLHPRRRVRAGVLRCPLQVPGPGHYKQYFTYDTTLAATHNRAPTVPIGLKPEPKIVYTKGAVTELPTGLYGMRKTYSTRAQMGKLGLGSDEIRFKVCRHELYRARPHPAGTRH